MNQIEYTILGEPQLVQNDNRRVTFTGFDKATGKEIVCMTHGNDDASVMLQTLKSKGKEILISGDYIPGGHGIMFHVDTIQFKVPQTAHN
jgi:hypothetical protein